MKLKWHPLAIDDQQQIVTYCKMFFGTAAAMRIKENIRNTAKLLKNHPCLGSIEPRLAGCTSLEYRSLVADKYTKIIYTIHSTYIYIHLLWDVRQDENRLRQAVARRYKPAENEPPYMVNEPPADYGHPAENEKDNSAKTGK